MLADDGVVPHEEPSRLDRKLERHARWNVVEQVSEKVNGAAEGRLCTVATLGGVEAAIVEDADIVHAAIGLDEVVIEQVHVVTVDVDGGSATVRVAFGRAVRGNAYRVMEISDGIAGDNVALAVNLHGIVAGEQVGAVSGYRPRVTTGLAR